MQFRLRYPRLWKRLAAFLGVALVAGAVAYFFAQPKASTPRPITPPSLEPQQLEPTQLEQTRNRFGPWTLLSSGAMGAPRVAMLMEGGSTEVSVSTVRISNGWVPATTPFQIVAVKPNSKTVRLGLNNDHIYEVGYEQAFILQQAPTQAFAFRRDGPGKALLLTISVQRLAR